MISPVGTDGINDGSSGKSKAVETAASKSELEFDFDTKKVIPFSYQAYPEEDSRQAKDLPDGKTIVFEKGSQLGLCTRGAADCFVLEHSRTHTVNDIQAHKISEVERANRILSFTLNKHKLHAFEEFTAAPTKTQNSTAYLTAWATNINTLAQATNPTANQIGMSCISLYSPTNAAYNINQYQIEGEIIEKLGKQTFTDTEFHCFIIKTLVGGQELELPIVISNKTPTRNSSIIESEVLAIGDKVSLDCNLQIRLDNLRLVTTD